MKIDIFSHIVPKKYKEELLKRTKSDLSKLTQWVNFNLALSDLDIRFRAMDRTPDVVQVLTVALPPLEVVLSPEDAVVLAKIANDEMAELVMKYPNRFLAAAASLPLNDIDAALKETDRAITELGFKGVQIFSNINGEPLDAPKFKALYEKMAEHDLPIWIHPWYLPVSSPIPNNLPKEIQEYFARQFIQPIEWPIDTTLAMIRLALSGIFEDHPNIKFITHHCGGMVPFYDGRIGIENTRKFYADTAVWGVTGALMCGHAFFGTDHLLFGTDAPLGGRISHPRNPGETRYGGTLDTIYSIERMNIPSEDKEKIFYDNAIRLLRLVV